MKESCTIEKIRNELLRSKDEKERAIHYANIFAHSDITWEDLLNMLECKVLMGEQAAFKLHKLLGVKFPKEGPIFDPVKWREILKTKNIQEKNIIGR